ncbi:MAG: MFS transporter [Acidimicrobiia bacterium]|nr:MFS transporter [Acidimicrobiia bacterium]
MHDRIQRRNLLLSIFAVAYGTNVSTPLLLLYQDRLDLSAWTVTALFAAYPIGLIPALLLGGPASDLRGRRRTTLPFVVLSGVASVSMIVGANSLFFLYLGRVLLGIVSGVVFAGMSAWIQELDVDDEPLAASKLTSTALYAGFGIGPFVSGALGQWVAWPEVLPYLIHIAMVIGATALVARSPETVTPDLSRPVRPNLGIPERSRRTILRVVVPTGLVVFTFPSVAFGLFPVLLRRYMEGIDIFITGVVAVTATTATLYSRSIVGQMGPWRSAPVGMGLGAVGTGLGTIAFATGLWGLLLPAAVLLGVASGVGLTAGLRQIDIVTDAATRGALAGTFYVVAYGGMTTPVVVSTLAQGPGFAPVLTVVTLAGIGLTLVLRRAVRPLASAQV